MRLLIDTQIFIWAVIDSKKLSSATRQILLNATDVFVSAASIWEIAIKARLGKLEGNPHLFALLFPRVVFMSFPYPPAMRPE